MSNRHPANRQQSLELRPRPAGRRPLVHGLHRADHLPALSQDGRRADQAAVQPPAHRAAEVRLAEPAEAGRRRARSPLPPHPRRTRQAAGDARRNLQEGPARDPEPGHAAPADRGPDRAGEVVVDAGRREGRHLRGAARQECAEESPKGAGQYFTPRELIKAIVDCVQPDRRRHRLRPGSRHRRLSARRLRLRRPAPGQGRSTRTRRSTCGRSSSRAGNWSRTRPGCAS